MSTSLRKWMVAIALLVITGTGVYVIEVRRYAGEQSSMEIEGWRQAALFLHQQGTDKGEQRTRNIFYAGKKQRDKKRVAKVRKTKKKVVKQTPAKPAVVDMASRLRCLAVAKRGQQWTAYISLDGQEQMVKPGDVINEQVRILEITEAGIRVEDMKANKQSVVPVLGV